MRAFLTALALACVPACDDDGDGDTGAEGTSSASASSGSTGSADEDDDQGDSSGAMMGPVQIEASGTFNGEAFAVSCDFVDDSLGSRSCEVEPGMHTLQCRETVDGTGGVSGQLLVRVSFFATAQLGMTNYTVPGTGVEVGGTLDTGAGAASPNAENNQVTLEAFSPGVSGTGSFAAEWSDDGTNHFGTVSGTFDFSCP